MITDICKLCYDPKPLCGSHIIPEFFYEFLYDEKHRFNILSGTAGQRPRFAQKGMKEPLLCETCETKLSKYEGYARGVFLGGREIVCVKEAGRVVVQQLEYETLKLFQMSILWRAGVAKQPLFSNVDLGPHEERLRSMLISGTAGKPSEYGCAVICLLNNGKPLGDLITQPLLIRLKGHRCYRFFFGGFFWHYFVSSHRPGKPWDNLFLQSQGTMIVYLTEDGGENGYLRSLADNFGKHNPRWLR